MSDKSEKLIACDLEWTELQHLRGCCIFQHYMVHLNTFSLLKKITMHLYGSI